MVASPQTPMPPPSVPATGPATAPAPVLHWSEALGHSPSDKRLEILRGIAAGGSISQAARDAGVSYKAAWQAIDTLSNLAGAELVQRAVGGAGGGGAVITPQGAWLLRVADALAVARQQVLADLAGAGAAAGMAPAASTPPALGLRTSMRNQWPATVTALRRQGAVVLAQLSLAGPDRLLASLTRESAELLGLRQGLPVLALCKATAVRILPLGPGEDLPESVSGVAGRVARTARAGELQEVVLTSEGGLQWVGLTPPGGALRRGALARAVVDPAAVVLGSAD